MPQLRVQSGLAGLLHGVLEGADGGRIARVGRHIRPGQVRPDAADDDGSLTFRRGGLPHQLRPVLQPGSAAAEPAVQFQMDVRRPAQPAGGTGHDRQLLRASQGNVNVVFHGLTDGRAGRGGQIEPGQDRCGDAGAAQGQGLGELGGAQPVGTGVQRRAGHLQQTVAIGVSLHHRHEVRGPAELLQGADIV